MKASVNGRLRELPDDATIAKLLDVVHAPHRGIAVARNDRVVRSADFEREPVEEGDRIEIIRAVAGG